MKQPTSSTVRSGRPRSFDRQHALTEAMLQFWQHGYEGTSVTALTTAMGVTPPSLYAAFGNKERLFLEAARLYTGELSDLVDRLASASTAREAIHDFLVGSAVTYTGSSTPAGCLLASATASGSPASADVQRAVAEIRADTAQALRSRVQRDIDEALLPKETDPAILASLAVCLTQGMSVLARDGASRQTLLSIVDQSMKSWP